MNPEGKPQMPAEFDEAVLSNESRESITTDPALQDAGILSEAEAAQFFGADSVSSGEAAPTTRREVMKTGAFAALAGLFAFGGDKAEAQQRVVDQDKSGNNSEKVYIDQFTFQRIGTDILTSEVEAGKKCRVLYRSRDVNNPSAVVVPIEYPWEEVLTRLRFHPDGIVNPELWKEDNVPVKVAVIVMKKKREDGTVETMVHEDGKPRMAWVVGMEVTE